MEDASRSYGVYIEDIVSRTIILPMILGQHGFSERFYQFLVTDTRPRYWTIASFLRVGPRWK